MPRTVLIPLAALALLLCTCVTEKQPPGIYRKDPLAGPVASPATGARTVAAHVTFQFRPMGTIRYDGQHLPLVSPSGRFLAAQNGPAPSWPTVLAHPDGTPPLGARIDIYDLSEGTARLTPSSGSVPIGLLLGRSCDDAGFLVEAPHADGSRWIGRVDWSTGHVSWLVQGEARSAHAYASRSGELAYCRWDPQAGHWALVRRLSDGRDRTISYPGRDYLFPILADDGFLYVLALSASGLTLHGYSAPADAATGEPDFEVPLSKSGSPLAAYQAVAAARPGPPLILFHPALGRMVAIDPEAPAPVPLADRCVGADRVTPAGGFIQSTPEGLVYSARAGGPTTRVLADAYLPRATTSPSGLIVLLGPASDPRTLTVGLLQPTAP